MHAMPEGLNGIKLDLNESPEMRSKTDGFRSFVQYLLNNYLLQDSKFPFDQWNYHNSIQNGDMGITTNPLENINLKLKSKMGHGYLTQKSAFKKLKAFQEDEICLYTSNVAHNKMPKIKAKTLRREKMLMEHFNKFNNLKKEDQILNIDYFAVELGCYASDLDAKDYEKVPAPELNEIEENESDSNSIPFSMTLRSRKK